jgi:hypothetical protein
MTAQQIYNKYVVNFNPPAPWTIPYTVFVEDYYVDEAYVFYEKDEAIVVPELQAIMDLPNFYCWPFDGLSAQLLR